MDVEAFVDAHRPRWARLEALCDQRSLTAAEADELLDLYQSASAHLSWVRSREADPQIVAYLSWLVMRVRRRGLARAGHPARRVVGFFTATFPAALYRLRGWWLATLAANVVLAIALGAWFLAHPEFEAAVQDPEAVRRLVDVEFERYYSEYAASSFAFRVWTNNAWVSALCIALGVFGVPVLYLLWQNVLNLALVASIMLRHDRGALFFGLILPHGLLELTAVFVAGGVGLRLFWSWVAPGARSRATALAQEGRTAVGVAAGLVAVLLVSGVIEGFVTPSGLSTWARIGIGVVAEIAFFAYVFVLGRRAARAGVTGDVDATRREASAPAVG